MAQLETLAYVSQGLRLSLCAWGDPAAPPLVLLHGVRDHARAWDPLAEALSQRFRIFAPDLRGHGDSQWVTGGQYPSEAYVLDLAQLVESLGLSDVAILGHSLGGNVGLRYAAVFPEKVRRVIAIEGLSHSPKMVAERRAIPVEARLRDWIARASANAKGPRPYAAFAEVVARVRAEHPGFEPEFAAHWARHGARENDDGTYSFKSDPALRVFPAVELGPEEAERLWSRIACPALLVYGAQSWASIPVEDGRARHFRDAEVVTLEGAGHWAHHDRRDAFLKLALRFLTAEP